jgi:murein DD-endopeptidase MepM/ murein hydrolase activator NlpD
VTLGKFPRTHLAVASTLGFALLLIAFTLPDPDAAQDARISELSGPIAQEGRAREAFPAGLVTPDALATPENRPQSEDAAGIDAIRDGLQAAIELTAVEYLAAPPDAAPQKEDSRTSKVQSGDSLSVIFKREGISSQDLHQLVTSEPLGKRLRDILPGQELSFTLSPEATLTRFEYVSSPLQRLVFTREGNEFVGEEVNREPERSTTYKQGVIENSLFLASQRAGLNDTMTMRLAQIFQWDIDFVLDIRRGDEFAVLFEELHVDGEFVGHGNILAAEFVNRGRTYKAIRYTDGNGDTHYYTPDGKPMRQAFLRAPVEFSRISSNFNMNRRHPLFNRSMPHRGIDYSAPTGTPILAAGDGRIVTASRTAPNGNYLVVQHGSQVTTKYLHLSKFGPGIKQGMRVKQGQVIGYVGATGWATGPHLHYEFVVNGVHQNPRTVKLPQGEPIPRSEMARFKAEAAPLLALLNDRRQEQQIALAQ